MQKWYNHQYKNFIIESWFTSTILLAIFHCRCKKPNYRSRFIEKYWLTCRFKQEETIIENLTKLVRQCLTIECSNITIKTVQGDHPYIIILSEFSLIT